MGWSFVGNVVIHCAGGVWDEEHARVEGTDRELGDFYAEILGVRILRDDWIKVGRERAVYPQLAMDGIADPAAYRAPQWGAPDRPQQMHLHIAVPDLVDAEALVVARGGTRLGDHGPAQAYADPVGHAFCLVPGDVRTAHELELVRTTTGIAPSPVDPPERRIAAVVIDCLSPRSSAPFYEALLGMRRALDTPALVELVPEHGMGPALELQHVPGFVPPLFQDDSRHQQLHLDLWFEDLRDACEVAERYGGIRLPHPGLAVYADPSGHPLCLLELGQ